MNASHQHRSGSGERGDHVRSSSLSRLPGHLVPIRVEPTRPPRPLTRGQAAQLLGPHARTNDRWSRLNLLRTDDVGGTVRIPAEEAQRLLSASGSESSAMSDERNAIPLRAHADREPVPAQAILGGAA